MSRKGNLASRKPNEWAARGFGSKATVDKSTTTPVAVTSELKSLDGDAQLSLKRPAKKDKSKKRISEPESNSVTEGEKIPQKVKKHETCWWQMSDNANLILHR